MVKIKKYLERIPTKKNILHLFSQKLKDLVEKMPVCLFHKKKYEDKQRISEFLE